MLFTTVAAAIPFTANAAYSDAASAGTANVPEGFEEANLNSAELEAYIDEYLTYNFSTAAEMLNYELTKGYLYYVNSVGNAYTMFVNKYTGFVYYVNNLTGQILTSNPINPATAAGTQDKEFLMSQISVSFTESANSTSGGEYSSVKWAARRAQISVTAISGGLRVNYTLGDTTTRFLLPGMLTAEAFESTILIPMLDSFEELLIENCGEEYPDENFSFFDNELYTPYEYGCINTVKRTGGLILYLEDMQKIYRKALSTSSAEYQRLNKLYSDIIKIIGAYSLKAPEKYIGQDRYKTELEAMYKNYPITQEGIAVYVYAGSNLPEEKRPLANIIKRNCSEYTFSLMYAQEKEVKYVDNSVQKPVFRCALEYTFNSDNSLSVRLPASSIVFDETVYTLDKITPLQYFGGADMTGDGYVFYPDGSGTIIEFDDFYSSAKTVGIEIEAPIYGLDYCYSKLDNIAGISHRAQVTMPVFGIVNDVKANEAVQQAYGCEKYTNGYFAIIEEGSALATLMVKSGGDAHRFIGSYAYYTPYPSDIYDLSETLSVGSLGIYKIVSKSKYTGSYVTRYVMLGDEAVFGDKAAYDTDYVGMATYYRDYLKNNGVLTALENISADLPLYIETLGAMDIMTRFLSFPVTETIPLTTFENVSQIYEELSACESFVVSKVAEYTQLAANETDDVQKYQYEQQAKRYGDLVGKIQNIRNINFKLTGFANGGMQSTYPAKLKWVKACGGKSGFSELVSTANTVSAQDGYSFKLYPDFDFMYITKTGSFDGIDTDEAASVMVDNRYASKQIYNSVMQEFETFFTLVVSPDAIEGLYEGFEEYYSKFENKNISVSTMGSDLNSNFDKNNPINREQAMVYVEEVLDAMANVNGYEVMVDTGNVYAVEYATHILNMPIDSSHHRYTSYTVPFSALVLHSYVSYTGEPINYSGSPTYDMLRAIENGAALYYIVCFQNTSYMKDDENLNKYFGVDYHNWFDDIVENYAKLNSYIGGLQDYEIVDHDMLLAEREIEESEMAANYVRLETEIIEFLDKQLLAFVDSKLAELKGNEANYDKRIKISVNKDALLAEIADILNVSVDGLSADFTAKFDALVLEYTEFYCGADDAANTVEATFSDFEYGTGEYVTKYTYITDSFALDKDYVYTNYTIDNGNVTMVTYQKGDSTVKFILNYNNFNVTVRLSATEVYELSAYGCVIAD